MSPSTISRKPRKQRRLIHKAPLHTRHKFMHAHLSEALMKEYKRRSLRVAKGDTVKVMRGDNKGHEAEVQSIDLQKGRMIVEGIVVAKADGSEVPKPIHPSKVVITKLNLKDKMRADRLKE
jgi:large subunit ribosomal protein L24